MPRILLIDDDRVDRKSVSRALKAAEGDWELVEAADRAEARRELANGHIDGVLLDYRLPDVDGLDLLRELVADPETPGLAVVMLTGEGSEMIAVEAMKRGAMDYLPKSALDPDLLQRVLRSAVERVRLKQELHEARRQLERMALFDGLTGLGNRYLFQDTLARTLATAARQGQSFAVLFLDLDRFKPVNDRYGHEEGDLVLAEVGRRLAHSERAADAFYRLGGDEFAAVLMPGTDADGAHTVAERVRESLARPFETPAGPHHLGVSIGVAAYPDDGTTAEDLIRAADHAMYVVKHRHRGDADPTVIPRRKA